LDGRCCTIGPLIFARFASRYEDAANDGLTLGYQGWGIGRIAINENIWL